MWGATSGAHDGCMFNTLHPDTALRLAADRRRRVERDIHRIRLPRLTRRNEPAAAPLPDSTRG
jgi:hypothetical protein